MKKHNFESGLKKIDKRVIVGTLLFLCCLHLSAATYRNVGDNVWKEFRKQFPTPFRTIACHEMDDGRRVYIVSEPPNNVDLNSIEKLFDGFVHYAWVNSTTIGYDGMMRDVVVYTDGIPDFCHKQIVNDLNQLLYGTTYKASYLSLPYRGKPKSCFYDMDINVTVNDKTLYEWIYNGNNRFKNVLTGAIATPYDLIENKQLGIFSSTNNNIVVWCIPSKTDISGYGYLFHIFQIESDLIMGVIYSNGVVMIVGRKRLCDIVSVPPLREDEALMLAAADEEIGQSLNITTPVYCKIDGIYDWCPAWVSDNIAHSEYAHLLTVTDNYLKFWLRYDSYDIVGYNNCKPWVSFDKVLFKGIRSILYNWNTNGWINGSIYNIYGHKYLIMHFNNIGCLNFNLFNTITDTSLAHIERLAYDYFIKCRSTDVFRAAQYTMLYEIFRRFDINANKYTHQKKDNNYLPFLTSAQTILSRIRDLTDYEIVNISKEIYKNEIESLISNFTTQEKVDFVSDASEVRKERDKWDKALKTITQEEANKMDIPYEQYLKTNDYKKIKEKVESKITEMSLFYFDFYKGFFEGDYYMNDLVSPIEKSRDKLKQLSSIQFQHLCKYCASPNTYTGEDINQIKTFLDTLEIQFILSRYSKYFGIQINDLFDDYVRYYKNDGRKWFKAPSVMAINNEKNYNRIAKRFKNESSSCIGGHNISNTIQEQPPSSFSQGQHVLSLTGDPIGDAYYYGQKAVNAVSRDDMYRYYRKSVEALSEEITPNKRSSLYNSLYSKIERAIVSSTISNNKHTDKQEIINDYKEVIDIAQYELSNNNDLAPEKKESYQFVISTAQKVTSIVEQKEEIDDEELKMLREQLKRAQLTLAELKKSQGGGK